jgi:uncharacterized small protein (TIGR04563 family)
MGLKQSLYFNETTLKEIVAEATRQDRSLSWIVQKAWKIARQEIMALGRLRTSAVMTARASLAGECEAHE